MLTSFTLLAAGSLLSLSSAQRTITVKNECDSTIWPAMYTELSVSPSKPDQPTGWEAPAGDETSFTVPRGWSGRIWGRRGCDFSSSSGPDSCLTGGCNGGLECDQKGGTGVPPSTLAEFTLDSDSGDWYDISLVDGFDLTMTLDNNAGCKSPVCLVDINQKCPDELQVKDDDGTVIACNTACGANLDGDAANSPNCCSGDYDTPETCPTSGIQYYDVFKGSCPNAYGYAYDEDSNSALWICETDKQADYTVTFCPSGQASANASASASGGGARKVKRSGWGSRAHHI